MRSRPSATISMSAPGVSQPWALLNAVPGGHTSQGVVLTHAVVPSSRRTHLTGRLTPPPARPQIKGTAPGWVHINDPAIADREQVPPPMAVGLR